MKENYLSFQGIEPFSFSITHVPHILPSTVNGSHIHDQCEIYVNVSGKVSFMVEGQLYPVSRGNAVITRPFEYHHCVYQEMAPHEHYWILFSSAGNEALLDPFFQRPAGSGNLIVLPEKQTEQLLSLCNRLTGERAPLDHYTDFFRLLQLLNAGNTADEAALPQELQAALEEINRSFTAPISIEQLAKSHFMSINTLERQFKTHLGVTPSEYLRQKRLAHAARLLQQQASVSEAAAKSGFSDVSQFITLFKKHFSKTPFQYKKATLF